MKMEKEVQKAMAKAKSSLDRIDDLEKLLEEQNKSLKQVVTAVNGSLGQLNRSLEETKEMLNAVIGILGPDQVHKEVEANRLLALQKQVEETKSSIVKALEAGDIVAAEVASDNSFVAGVELKADGTAIPPGWSFVPMQKIEEEFRLQLVGKGVGHKISTKEGGSFELLEIYDMAEKKVEPAIPVPAQATVDSVVVPAQENTAPAGV
jgi:hypothetical protein